jgi:hypothetical protein
MQSALLCLIDESSSIILLRLSYCSIVFLFIAKNQLNLSVYSDDLIENKIMVAKGSRDRRSSSSTSPSTKRRTSSTTHEKKVCFSRIFEFSNLSYLLENC